jgi:hypothetical protein
MQQSEGLSARDMVYVDDDPHGIIEMLTDAEATHKAREHVHAMVSRNGRSVAVLTCYTAAIPCHTAAEPHVYAISCYFPTMTTDSNLVWHALVCECARAWEFV